MVAGLWQLAVAVSRGAADRMALNRTAHRMTPNRMGTDGRFIIHFKRRSSMTSTRKMVVAAGCVGLACLAVAAGAHAQSASMTFFVTSAGSGKGADLGGLEGADKICQTLAQAVGAGGKTWRAYLSTQAAGGSTSVNARDRIGSGPWQNAKGDVIAQSVDDLHSPNNKITKQTALNEKGEMVNGRGDTPNRHDVLTGSQPDGRGFSAGDDRTCGNW